MDDNERITQWLEEIEELKQRAAKVAQQAQDKQREYQGIMQKIADCERAIREGRVKGG